MRTDWVIAVDKGWFLWRYVLFANGEPKVYGVAFSERGAWAKAKNRRDRIVARTRTARMRQQARKNEIARKTVV